VRPFELETPYSPSGDQPQAIVSLVEGLEQGISHQVLMGVTGSGKTFTMANVIAETQRPALVLVHNKTLAAQLYGEFRTLFPNNSVQYFVSYYDYYQPEAYVVSTDTFIEKDAKINEEIDRMRHAATRALLERRDVIIVASVSCIYGLGSAQSYHEQLVRLETGQTIDRDAVLAQLVNIQYARNDYDFHRGMFRVRGDILEVFPVHEETEAIRIEFFGDEIEGIYRVDPLRGRIIEKIDSAVIYPSSHYVVGRRRLKEAVGKIRTDLAVRLRELNTDNKLLESQRLEQRTSFDLEQMEQIGHCAGIENYSRYLTGRKPGDPPPCLLDYFPEDWILFIDESHVAVPQVGGMYRGDRSRKTNLVEHGFRLPSALDNRPLKFEEFVATQNQVIYVSATPNNYEIEQSNGVVVEQLIRPTGLIDPLVEVRPALHQVDDLLSEIRTSVAAGHRVLVTTLTKRMAEDLTEYYRELEVGVRYLHSDIDTLERTAILRDLRLGKFDVLVGINLLREGLDLPEVGLVAIFDADKEGFLRNRTSLIQTIGRAARNVDGRVILYAETITGSMKGALQETERRRKVQAQYNLDHGIVPQTIQKPIGDIEDVVRQMSANEGGGINHLKRQLDRLDDPSEIKRLMDKTKAEMLARADAHEFEEAAKLRDEVQALQKLLLIVS
jgi:excinuclease ABC subunit B